MVGESRLRPESVMERALSLTRETFLAADSHPVMAAGQNIAYAVYGLFHRQVALPLALSGAKVEGRRTAKAELFNAQNESVVAQPPKEERGTRIGRLVRQAAPLAYTMVSLLYLILRRSPRVAVWTGDFIDGKSGADFRIGGLYASLERAGLCKVEFIRANAAGFGPFWRNALLRKRPAVYYDALTEYLGWLFPRPIIPQAEGPLGRAYGLYQKDLVRVAQSIPILRAVYRLLEIREVIAWEYSDRQAGLIHAARSLGIPVLGFMHGAGMQSYMAHEFIEEYRGNSPLAADVFGVWSPWWKEYFQSRSRLYGQVEVSGTFRKSRLGPEAGTRAIRKILWISEPLAEVEDIIPFLESLAGRFHLGIKKRPSTADSFYNALLKARPGLAKLETLDGDIFEAMKGFDAVVGSHSTAVLDASWQNKPFMLVHTTKWGDYFGLAGWDKADWLVAHDPDSLLGGLERWGQVDPNPICSAVRERFYGDPMRDGCEWAAGVIQSWRANGTPVKRGPIHTHLLTEVI